MITFLRMRCQTIGKWMVDGTENCKKDSMKFVHIVRIVETKRFVSMS